MATQNRKQIVSATAYATAADFKHIFTEDIDRFYLLALLLTGTHQKAEECFVEGIRESTKEDHVFKEWARSWARRTIIQSAIQLIAPRERSVAAIRTADVARVMDRVPMALHAEVSAILELAPFERFVFVMSVLERYSDNDCSLLLGCPQRDIATARAQAMQQLATLLGEKSPADSAKENSAAPENVVLRRSTMDELTKERTDARRQQIEGNVSGLEVSCIGLRDVMHQRAEGRGPRRSNGIGIRSERSGMNAGHETGRDRLDVSFHSADLAGEQDARMGLHLERVA